MKEVERIATVATIDDVPQAKASVPKVIDLRDIGAGHHVVTLTSEGRTCYPVRQEPCEKCPWRKDRIGGFPVDSFRLSADTAYAGSVRTFACHMAGQEKPQTCAGSVLSTGSKVNAALVQAAARGEYDPAAITTEAPLFESYRAMSIANGVDPDDPSLEACR